MVAYSLAILPRVYFQAHAIKVLSDILKRSTLMKIERFK